MNPDPEKLRKLLDELLPSSSKHCGPTSADLQSMLQNERRRRRLRTGAALLAIIALTVGFLFSIQKPSVNAPVAKSTLKPARLAIHQVNDEELLALLDGTPAGLMELRDGSRMLLVIEGSSVHNY
jgi:hypothetical protein